jgi:integrase
MKTPDFSKRSLDKLLGTQGQRLVIHDSRTPGLRAELREGGSITYFVFKRLAGGGPRRVKIGTFPEVTIDSARSEALDVLSELSQGRDVARDRRARRQESTLKDLFGHWLESHAKLHKRTWQEDQRQFDKLLDGWHNRRLSSITRTDVRTLHARIGKNHGHYAANRLLSLLRAMFNRAGELGYTGDNPTKGIRKFKEQSRDRYLQPDEFPKFIAAVNGEPNETLRDFFLMLLYTGARRSNVQAMAWADVSLDAATWRIPDTKSGDAVTVHLPGPALVILATRKAMASGSPWVFPGGKKNQGGHLRDPKAAWAKLLERAGIENLRLHDLRRTLGSWQAAAGASMQIIGKSLGHKAGSPATAIYSRLSLDPVRASVDTAVAAMVAASSKESSNG